MVVKRLLARFTAGGRVPVFAAVGAGGREAVEELSLDPRVEFVHSPRHANVLLLAGCFPSPMLRPALRVHDAVPHPRATVWWPRRELAGGLTQLFPDATVIAADEEPAPILARVYHDLLSGGRSYEPPIQPDVPPRPWRGVGPYGQGGKGMTGGHPYGRTMAGRAPDRDGLELDQLPLRVGPFFPHLPPGLVLHVKFQGDVVQEAALGANPFEPPVAASDEPVPIAELERARARSHLRALARMLRLRGLHALSERTLRLALDLPSDAGARIRSLARLLERTPALRWATAGVGIISAERLSDHVAGPVARASGVPRDARAEEPAYVELGFEIVVQKEGDARARWRQRLAEAAQSLSLADRADERSVRPSAVSERSTAALVELLPSLLVGKEWGDAVTTLVSLDLDLEEAAASPPGDRAVA